MMYPATAFQIYSAIVRTQPAVESEAIEAGTVSSRISPSKKTFPLQQTIIKIQEHMYRWLYQVSSLSLFRLTSEFK